MTREGWLIQMVDSLRPHFADAGYTVPDLVRVSVGWPSARGLAAQNRVIGQAWSPECSEDGVCETFISPYLDDPLQVGAVLVHELVHHAVGVGEKHGSRFRAAALSVGLEGKMTATHAGDWLEGVLSDIIVTLGEYPHKSLDSTKSPIKKQSTRMLKVSCPECGYTVRTTRKWLEVGLPTCPCESGMECEEPEGEDDNG